MALGGGGFTAQDKILPGAYINFVSRSTVPTVLGERGVVAMPFELDWGVDNGIFEVTDLFLNAFKIFGYNYNHAKLKGMRDLFRNAKKLYAYRLNSSGAKAVNEYATAKYGGVRGNDFRVSIQINADDTTKKDVRLYLETALVDTQTVNTAAQLTDNDFVIWKKNATLAVTAAAPLAGGTNGTVTTADYQSFLNAIEGYSFNTIGVVTDSAEIQELFSVYCKRMREEIGKKMQAVIYNKAADHEGIINVVNAVSSVDGAPLASLVYWVTGAAAACEVNSSLLNKIYDGEFDIALLNTQTQNQLQNAIKDGCFAFHRVGNDVRVLSDINSLVTITEKKGEVFKDNKTIRIIDQIANDIGIIFSTQYLGQIPNNESGRASLWNDIVTHHRELERVMAIENFEPEKVIVMQGEKKNSISVNSEISVAGTMAILYMNVLVE